MTPEYANKILAGGELLIPGRKPIGQVAVDWNDKINDRLEFCVLFDGVGRECELVTRATVARNGVITPRTENFQQCADITGGSFGDYYDIDHRSSHNITDDLTLCFAGVVDGTTGYRHLLGKQVTNGATNSPFEFRLETGSTTQKIIRADAAGRREFTNASGLSVGVFSILFVTSKTPFSAANTKFWVNGTKYAATHVFGTITSATGNTAAIRIGRRGDGATQLDGAVSMVAGWSRALNDEEIIAKTRSLFKGLKPANERLFIYSATAPTGRIMSSLVGPGGLASEGGIAGSGGGLAG